MPSPYTPSPVFDATVSLPDDGDPAVVSSVNTPLEALADRTQYLYQRTLTHRHKSADQTLAASAVLTIDTHIQGIEVEAAKYAFELYLLINADDTMDFKFQLDVPQISGSKTLGKIRLLEGDPGIQWLNLDGTGWDDVQSLTIAGPGNCEIHARGIFTFQDAGEVALYWAQATADAATLTVFAASFLKLDRVEA